ncbi:MAG: response regulator [Ignavibacteriaceae bacterium]|nr:response regulator [Ignavibacterium sp.]MCC6256000.1 response regulator [Ignavibacteriaceae bacterium]
MFHKIENRLIVLIVIVLLVFAGTVAYLKLNELNLIQSISQERNLSLKTLITNSLPDQNNNSQFLLDEDQLESIALKTGTKVKIVSLQEEASILNYLSDKPYIIYALILLKDNKGKAHSILFAKNESPSLKQKHYSAKKEYLTLIIIFLLLSLIITTALFLQIVKPISNIIGSITANKPEQLQKLLKTKSEYGVFANLIKEFFDQKKNLEEEVKVRKITQEELETLNDELEKRVDDRTEELAVTNLELQKERDQTKQYLDIAGTIIALFDGDGYIQLINKKGEEVLGYTQDELNGKNWFDICFMEKDKKRNKQIHREIIRGQRSPVEYFISEVITKGKEVRTLIFHNTYLKDSNNNVTRVLFSAEDITELKLKEKELIEAKEKADESNKLKSTFLANMSHELRTPMIGILGYSDLLIAEIENDNHKKMAKAIHDSGQRLIDTLNLILDLSRLEANKHNIDYKVVNLNELVKSVKFHFQAAAGRKKLFLKVSFPNYDVIARTDPRMLRDVMNNLINNALKFTNDGGVFITLEVFHRNFIITVKDTGIGIPEESLELIFEEFRQVSEGLGRGFQGTGLGLTICKKYIELLGGQISVKSTPKVGSEFSFQVPLFAEEILDEKFDDLEEEKNAAFNSIEVEDKNLKFETDVVGLKKKILVVEDDSTTRDIINLFLKKIYDVAFAADGEKALDAIIDTKYDLIIMDINLGSGINGIQVTEKIRKIAGYESIPVIAATAFAMLGDREKFLATGFDHYISKPYLKKQLVELISDVFSKH